MTAAAAATRLTRRRSDRRYPGAAGRCSAFNLINVAANELSSGCISTSGIVLPFVSEGVLAGGRGPRG